MTAPVTPHQRRRARITAPGQYEIPAPEYHADPVVEPSLSKSLAHIILDKTPKHGWMAHPRLNPQHEPDTNKVYDLGSAAHAIMLGEEDEIDVIDAANFQTKAARQARDDSLAAGRNPALTHVYEQAQSMVRAAKAQLARHEEGWAMLEADVAHETTLIWQQEGVWCRCRIDALPASGGLIVDYKTTGATANPEGWAKRQLFDTGAYLSDAAYSAAVEAVLGLKGWRMRYVVQENEPPYALSVVGLDPAAQSYAWSQWQRALATWRWCMEHDAWPGYPAKTAFAELPPWKDRELEDMKLREQLVREQDNKSLLEIGMKMQAPLDEVK